MIEGVLLTGGASRRMGRDKASIDLRGETMAERAARVLLATCERVTVLGPSPVLGLPNIPDRNPHSGPLLALADFNPTADLVVVLACDMPRVTSELIALLIETLSTPGYQDPPLPRSPQGSRFSASACESDACVPITDDRLHPTCAIYRADALRLARSVAESGQRSMMALLDALNVITIPVEQKLMKNVNEPGDFENDSE